MVLIQVNIPSDLDEEVAVESLRNGLKDKRKTIILILREYFGSKLEGKKVRFNKK